MNINRSRCSSRGFPASLLLLLHVLLFSSSGCGDRAVHEGTFHDSAVEGLSYSTPSFSGITDSSGAFEYRTREVVTFRIGEILLGEARAESVLTPLELADTASVDDPEVINIARFLQTLDADDEEGILITEDMRLAATVDIDFTQSVADFENDAQVQSYLAAFGNGQLIDQESAITHLEETLTTLGYNQPPEVDVGADQTVTSGDEVTISGAASDSDGFIVDFTWRYEQGDDDPDLSFFSDEEVDESEEDLTDEESNFTSLSERFTAPDVTTSTELTFRFTVEDDDGATQSDDLTVTVNPQ